MNKIVRLFESLDIFHTKDDFSSLIKKLQFPQTSIVVSFLNAHALNIACDNEDFFSNLIDSDFLLRDGIGIKLSMKFLGNSPGLNMNGTDLIPRFVEELKDRRLALFGTQSPWLDVATDKMAEKGIDVVCSHHGFSPIEDYVRIANDFHPELIILGMGMPKQEAVAASLKNNLECPAIIINGGAIFDFMAGRFPRSNMLWRKTGLEWLFRLINEPKRMWRRYLLGGAVFACRIIFLRVQQIFDIQRL